MSTNKKYQPSGFVINKNTKTVHKLRDTTKEQVLCGYYKLRKTDLIALLSEKSTQEMLKPPTRTQK